MGLREDIRPYIDRAGLISGQIHPSAPEGNALLRTAHYVSLLNRHGLLSEQDRNEVITNVTRECEVKPGLYRRAQNWAQDQEARDDYIALAYLAWRLQFTWAKYALWFGERHFYRPFWPLKLAYCYDNVRWDKLSPRFVADPGKDTLSSSGPAYLGRHREMMTMLKWAGDAKPYFWERAFFRYSLEHSGSATDQDGWMLGELQAEMADAFDERDSAGIFRRRMALQWPGDGHPLNRVFAAYLGNKDHPFTRYWK